MAGHDGHAPACCACLQPQVLSRVSRNVHHLKITVQTLLSCRPASTHVCFLFAHSHMYIHPFTCHFTLKFTILCRKKTSADQRPESEIRFSRTNMTCRTRSRSQLRHSSFSGASAWESRKHASITCSLQKGTRVGSLCILKV